MGAAETAPDVNLMPANGVGFDMCDGEKDKKTVEPTLEPLLQAHIGKQLRDMFGAMAREPVPDRFKLLLDRLEAGEDVKPIGASAAEHGADDEAGAI